MRKLLGALLLLAASVYGADITGTWIGPVKMKNGDETRNDTAHLVLKQEGGAITGTVGPAEGEGHAITKGTVEGENVYIEAAIQGENKVILRLKLAGDKMTGELKAEGPSAPPITGSLTVDRKK